MLPSNTASSIPMAGIFRRPDDQTLSPLRDYERGGVAVNDASMGLNVRDWVCWYESLEVRLSPMDGARQVLFTLPGIEHLSFSFDQNMRPVVAYMVGGVTKLRWYDPTVSAYVVTDFGSGLITPRLGMDDIRGVSLTTSDVIFAYIRYDAGALSYALCYRQQRDRYLTERVLRTGLSARTKIRNIGMSVNLRFQFELV